MRKLASARWSLLAMAAALTADAALAACKVSKLAELPVTLIGRRAIVDAKFGTHDARFIVDSGAFYSTLSRASASEFGLSSARRLFPSKQAIFVDVRPISARLCANSCRHASDLPRRSQPKGSQLRQMNQQLTRPHRLQTQPPWVSS